VFGPWVSQVVGFFWSFFACSVAVGAFFVFFSLTLCGRPPCLLVPETESALFGTSDFFFLYFWNGTRLFGLNSLPSTLPPLRFFFFSFTKSPPFEGRGPLSLPFKGRASAFFGKGSRADPTGFFSPLSPQNVHSVPGLLFLIPRPLFLSLLSLGYFHFFSTPPRRLCSGPSLFSICMTGCLSFFPKETFSRSRVS